MNRMEKPNGKEENQFKGFVSTALRPHRKRILDTSIAQHLALSVSAKPLKNIYHITQAALKLTPEQAEKVKVDSEELDVVRKVNLAFQTALKEKVEHQIPITQYYSDRYFVSYYSIFWGFQETVENYTKFIEPWRRKIYFAYRTNEMDAWTQKKVLEATVNHEVNIALQKEIMDKIDKLNVKLNKNVKNKEKTKKKLDTLTSRLEDLDCEEYKVGVQIFFLGSKYFYVSSFHQLQNEFLNWALPKSQMIFAKLSSFINPDIYREILEMYMKKGEVGAESESPVDSRE